MRGFDEERTPGASLVELRGSLVEQRVDGERQVELLGVQLLPRGRQRAGRVRAARLPAPAARLPVRALAVTVAITLLATLACGQQVCGPGREATVLAGGEGAGQAPASELSRYAVLYTFATAVRDLGPRCAGLSTKMLLMPGRPDR